MQLEGKTAIVTGGGQGLGRGIAIALAQRGAHVTVTGRTPATLDAVVSEIEDKGGSSPRCPGRRRPGAPMCSRRSTPRSRCSEPSMSS